MKNLQKGFTLVELAIVLTIIGLLIGGILKGQQLIANARVTAQISQVQAIEAATTTFTDTYAGLPGDLSTAVSRLPVNGCGGAACQAGDGNGSVGPTTAVPTVAAAYAAGAAGENAGFFLNLGAANLISGISSQTLTGGGALPMAKVNGTGVVLVNTLTNPAAPYSGGLWLTLAASNTAVVTGAGPGAGVNVMTASQAANIDRKLDDGVNTTGSIVAYGVAASCTTAPVAGTNPGGYVEGTPGANCGLTVRIQQ